MSVGTWLLDLLYPRRCVFCHRFLERGEDDVCPACRKKLRFTQSDGEQHGDFFSLCVSPLYYEDDVRESILRFKFQSCSGYAGAYAEFLAAYIRERLDGRYDLISWVPLSRKRLKERGYDQAKLLAEETAKHLELTVTPTLEKYRDVPRQSQMGSPEKRRANIAGVYRARNTEQIAGQRILLIDDVITSGSTLSECARTLRTHGVKEVLCATLARSAD